MITTITTTNSHPFMGILLCFDEDGSKIVSLILLYQYTGKVLALQAIRQARFAIYELKKRRRKKMMMMMIMLKKKMTVMMMVVVILIMIMIVMIMITTATATIIIIFCCCCSRSTQ